MTFDEWWNTWTWPVGTTNPMEKAARDAWNAARLQEPKAERSELPPRETFSLLPTAEVEELKSQLAQCRQREQEMRGKLKDIRAYVRDGLYHASLDAIEEVLAAIKEESNGK